MRGGASLRKLLAKSTCREADVAPHPESTMAPAHKEINDRMVLSLSDGSTEAGAVASREGGGREWLFERTHRKVGARRPGSTWLQDHCPFRCRDACGHRMRRVRARPQDRVYPSPVGSEACERLGTSS